LLKQRRSRSVLGLRENRLESRLGGGGREQEKKPRTDEKVGWESKKNWWFHLRDASKTQQL